jgi:histidinol dehydrogenase
MKNELKHIIKTVKWSSLNEPEEVLEFLQRPPVDMRAEQLAAKIVSDIKNRRDEALLEYITKFDSYSLPASELRVSDEELNAAKTFVDNKFKNAIEEANARIVDFSKASLRADWSMPSLHGGQLGERFVPLDRVGVYIPGGTAPLISTVLMTVTLAKVAQVPEIVACTPADSEGKVNPFLLYALGFAGATEIYKVGGIQAIGAMAYGTETVKKVQKIVGPGGPYVTAAKKLVYGDVALDMIAGPSEIAILADELASPAYVAADLLSQAEHGTGEEKALLVTTSEALAEDVKTEILKQTKELSRKEFIHAVLKMGTLIVIVENLEEGMGLCNRFAPEHLELLIKQPENWIDKVTSAGAVFVGPWTPECVGDFVAGPSHVLPTGGTAHAFSGLTVNDFRKRISIIDFKRLDLEETLPIIETIGRVEGLDAHSRSAEIRFE